VNFGRYIDKGFEMQLHLSDYLFYSVINSLYYPGVYIINETLPVTTTTLDLIPLIFGRLSKAGWEKHQPCITVLRVIGETPDINITKKNGLSMQLELAFDIKCKKHAADKDYS
jgi:hypothetical protein